MRGVIIHRNRFASGRQFFLSMLLEFCLVVFPQKSEYFTPYAFAVRSAKIPTVSLNRRFLDTSIGLIDTKA